MLASLREKQYQPTGSRLDLAEPAAVGAATKQPAVRFAPIFDQVHDRRQPARRVTVRLIDVPGITGARRIARVVQFDLVDS